MKLRLSLIGKASMLGGCRLLVNGKTIERHLLAGEVLRLDDEGL